MYLRTDSVKSRENIFFRKNEKERSENITEIDIKGTKINQLLSDKYDKLYGEFDWVLFENNLFNVEK